MLLLPSTRQLNLVGLTHVDDIKMVGRKESLAPMWARLRKKIELEDPSPFVISSSWRRLALTTII